LVERHSNGASERHQNNNLKVMIAYAKFLGTDVSFYNIHKGTDYGFFGYQAAQIVMNSCRGFVIPRGISNSNSHEHIRTVEELVSRDLTLSRKNIRTTTIVIYVNSFIHYQYVCNVIV
jgi:hypothetical protein